MRRPMRMAYWTRILIGALLGAAALGALWYLTGITWATAAAAALLAPVGFLGSYFVWSADRPEDGYEQVLFDRPNTLVSAVMIVAFATLGIFSGVVPLAAEAPPAAALRTPAEGVAALQSEFDAISAAYDAGEKDSDQTVDALLALREKADAVGDEIDALPDGEPKDALVEAYDWVGQAIIQMKECAAGREDKCEAAQTSMADAKAALRTYRALAAAE